MHSSYDKKTVRRAHGNVISHLHYFQDEKQNFTLNTYQTNQETKFKPFTNNALLVIEDLLWRVILWAEYSQCTAFQDR